MITFFTIPKPFEGHIGVIQRNALRSWLEVAPGVQVIVIGETPPSDLGVEHVADIARNEHGTPLLNDAFRIARERASNTLLCYVNADILLPRSLARAGAVALARADRFLVIGECWNATVTEPFDAEIPWLQIAKGARKRGADAIDYFLFTRGVYHDIPPFAVGRMVFDNWLVWRARSSGATLIDATWAVHPIHQDHTYAHVGSLSELRGSDEAEQNLRYAGGNRSRLYSRFDATHRLVSRHLIPSPIGVGHAGETVRRAWAKLLYSVGWRPR